RQAGAELRLRAKVEQVDKIAGGFSLKLAGGEEMQCHSLVIATGGKSIPKMGASDFGYWIASQFGLGVIPTRPALVPLTFDDILLKRLNALSGVAVPARVQHDRAIFDEALLFTHRGLSGPAILQ